MKYLVISIYLLASITSTNAARSFIQYPLSAGLPPLISEIDNKLNEASVENRGYLIIHTPDNILDFDNPKTIKSTLLSSGFSQLNVGHLQFAWSCKIGKKRFQSATGFTGDLENKSFIQLKKGFGLSPFISTFKDAHLETPREVQNRMIKSLKEENLEIISFVLGDKCENILARVWSFINSEKSNNFSLAKKSYTKKRSGYNCTSLVISWLDSLPRTQKLLTRSSLQKMSIPKKFFGNSAHKVSLYSLGEVWKGERVDIDLYDPGTLSKSLNSEKFQKTTMSLTKDKLPFSMFLIKKEEVL